MNKFKRCCKKFHWESWHYSSGKLNSLKKEIPSKPGVYIIKAPKALRRVRSSSKIVYIGQSGGWSKNHPKGGKQGVGTRLFNTRGADEAVRILIEKEFKNLKFSIYCHFTNGKKDPRKIEIELLDAYLMEFLELPPANHNRSILKKLIPN